MTGTWSKGSRPLNEKLKACSPPDAVFAEKTRRDYQEVKAYDHAYAAAAEAEAARATGPEVGEGKGRETRTVAGIPFSWEGTLWAHEEFGVRIELHPKTNQRDATETLKTIRSLYPIPRRKTIKRDKIIFRVGLTWINKLATAVGNIISVPFAINGTSLFAACLARASKKNTSILPVKLQDILLHEVAHTLRVYYLDARDELQVGVSRNFHKTRELMEEISPHYLGKQHQDISAKFALLNVKIHIEDNESYEAELDDAARKIGAELFAEVVRYFYLEPVLTKKIPKPAETGFRALDRFCGCLVEEAQITVGRNPIKPEFPTEGER